MNEWLEHCDCKQDYDHDANIPRLGIGETRYWAQNMSRHFSDIREQEIVQSISNNLYRAPIFRQRHTNDYLLICTRAMMKEMHFIVRALPSLLTVGQWNHYRCATVRRDPKTPYSNRVTEVQHKLTLAARYFAENMENNALSTGVEFPDREERFI